MKLVWTALAFGVTSCAPLPHSSGATSRALGPNGVWSAEEKAAPSVDRKSIPRCRARDLRIPCGDLPTGRWNSITDVPGVLVGHTTVSRGTRTRTGVTVVLPHAGNLYRSKVPAAVAVANGYGKLVGTTQVRELGEIESPIALTNTLNVGKVMDALVGHSLAQKGNEKVRSVNVIVGETNDGRLNDIRVRAVDASDVTAALTAARSGPVVEGAVGAGTGTICFGWKGGIGTASRQLKGRDGEEWHVGVLVQTNFGGALTVAGRRMDRLRPPVGDSAQGAAERQDEGGGSKKEDGSCMIVVATDAPLSPRALERVAHRAFAGMARTGASFSNGSGDYAIAFSTHASVRRVPGASRSGHSVVAHSRLTPLFRAVAEATEEAILNSLCAASTTTGCGRTVHALPLESLRSAFRK